MLWASTTTPAVVVVGHPYDPNRIRPRKPRQPQGLPPRTFPPSAATYTGTAVIFSGDICADILPRRTDNGTLRLYKGNCDGTIDGTSGGVIGPGLGRV